MGFANVYYCDTDSILTNEHGKEIIEKKYAGDKLGELVLEDSSDYVELFGLKDYHFGKRKRLKGVSKSAKKVNEDTYEFLHWGTTIEAMKSGKQDAMFTEIRRKTLSRRYSKGTVNPDGTISPLAIFEEE